VRANLKAAGLEKGAAIVRAELPGWLGRTREFDVALCDPPYAFVDWATLLGSLRASVAVLESSAPLEVPQGWAVTKQRRYGGTLVTVVRPAPALHSGATGGSASPPSVAVP
jgi:16S rRNA (guanine966-N2)-methyltransferase